MKYYRIDDFSLHEIDPAQYAGWVAAGNPRAGRFAPVPVAPAYDPTTHTCEWANGKWLLTAIRPSSRKVWPTNAHFWAEFTPGEQVAIAARQEGPVRALLISFSVWPAEMWSDDERVVKAMQALVAVGAITPGRAEEILKPSA